ncbi:MAG: branched-chain amino acid ABC transporter permease, partial [Christensenellales bacterium]
MPSFLKTPPSPFSVSSTRRNRFAQLRLSSCLIHFFMKKSRFGIAMRAAAMDPLAAGSCGINVNSTTRITWAISTTVAGLAGMMVGPLYGVTTTLGTAMSAKGFASAVVGGYGDMYGAILGGGVLAGLET